MSINLPKLFPLILTWAESQAAEVADKGAPLDQANLLLAREMGVAHPERIRIRQVDLLPMPDDPSILQANQALGLMSPVMGGLTLGYSIFLRQGAGSRYLLAHEFRHVHQYEQEGSIAAFLVTYLHQILDFGYQKAPYEVDANVHAQYA